MAKKTYTATEARKQFYKLLRAASKPGSRITVTLEGQDPVLLISSREYQEDIEGWLETFEVMSDPQLVKDIEEAKQSNDFMPLEDFIKELGWKK